MNGEKRHIILGHYVTYKEKLLSPQMDRMGYVHVRLIGDDKKYVLFKVHQLVAQAFLNHDRKDRSLVVHHINHIKTDNRLNNLEVQLRSEHSSKHKKNEQ